MRTALQGDSGVVVEKGARAIELPVPVPVLLVNADISTSRLFVNNHSISESQSRGGYQTITLSAGSDNIIERVE